ncbi:MAG: Aminodeoxychorismate lyase, partial [uncultured Quadrisphaera sp.]
EAGGPGSGADGGSAVGAGPWVLRLTWTGGPGPLASSRLAGATGSLVVAAAPVPAATASTAAVTVAWTRNERSPVAGLKTTSYAENVVALRHARDRGATEALLPNTRGELCEGTGSNVVVALPERPGELLTPPLSSGCLAGITRQLLLRWASEDGLAVREEVLPASVLERADEVLLLSSLRDVQAVHDLDGRALVPGELGRRAAELFARRSAADPDPRV